MQFRLVLMCGNDCEGATGISACINSRPFHDTCCADMWSGIQKRQQRLVWWLMEEEARGEREECPGETAEQCGPQAGDGSFTFHATKRTASVVDGTIYSN